MSKPDDEKSLTSDVALDQDVVAAIAASTRPLAPPSHLKQRVMDRVRSASVAPITSRGKDGWHQLEPGIEYKLLFADHNARSKSFLLRAAAGSTMPGHHHSGPEECLVLEGEFTMGDLTLRQGDFHCVGAGTYHDVARTETGVLIYLRADINDYPMIQV